MNLSFRPIIFLLSLACLNPAFSNIFSQKEPQSLETFTFTKKTFNKWIDLFSSTKVNIDTLSKNPDTPNAIIIYPLNDSVTRNNYTLNSDRIEIIREMMNHYNVHLRYINKINELPFIIKQFENIAYLEIGGHGNHSSIHFGTQADSNFNFSTNFSRDQFKTLNKDATVFIRSCKNAEGLDNLAKQIGFMLPERTIIASIESFSRKDLIINSFYPFDITIKNDRNTKVFTFNYHSNYFMGIDAKRAEQILKQQRGAKTGYFLIRSRKANKDFRTKLSSNFKYIEANDYAISVLLKKPESTNKEYITYNYTFSTFDGEEQMDEVFQDLFTRLRDSMEVNLTLDDLHIIYPSNNCLPIYL